MMLEAYTNISNPQTLYVRIEDDMTPTEFLSKKIAWHNPWRGRSYTSNSRGYWNDENASGNDRN